MAGIISRKDFLTTLFHDYFSEYSGFVVVKTVREYDQKTGTRFFPNVESLSKEQYSKDENVFFGLCPRERMKPGPENIKLLTCLWAGLDLAPGGFSGREGHFPGPALAAKAVRSFHLPPSIIVESGQGLHLYWLLDQVVSAEENGTLEAILVKINEYFQCKRQVKLDSMLRLPETTNCKNAGRPTECRVKYLNAQFTYTLADFEQIEAGSKTGIAPAAFAEPRPEEPQPDDVVADSGEAVVEILEEYMARDEPTPHPIDDAGPRDPSGPQVQSTTSDETVLDEEVLDQIADRVADKVVEKLSSQIVDRIAAGVLSKLGAQGSHGKPSK